MKVYADVIQGTAEWLELRAGIPTSSEFDRILTPKTGKPSSQAEGYMFRLIAERLMGHPVIEFMSRWMDRGSEMEAEAVTYYEFQRDVTTQKIGFLTNDSGTVGSSPDRFVNDEGLLEIKVPKESTHVGYLLKHHVDAEYWPQVQGQLWISERQWVDILSYHPEMPPALIRVERDEAFIKMLSAAVTTFSEVLEANYQLLLERGIGRQEGKALPSLEALLKESLIAINNAERKSNGLLHCYRQPDQERRQAGPEDRQREDKGTGTQRHR